MIQEWLLPLKSSTLKDNGYIVIALLLNDCPLGVLARTINDAMKIAAVHAIRVLVKEPVSAEVLKARCEDKLMFGKDYIIPKPMDPRLCAFVAKGVVQAAVVWCRNIRYAS